MRELPMTLVTDDPDKALSGFFCCAQSNKPIWARVASDPVDIMRIPNGMKCRGLFFSRHSGAELAWWDRRTRGGIEWLDDADLDYINEWIEEHVIRRAALYFEAVANETATPRIPITATPEPIRNMPMTQRWT